MGSEDEVLFLELLRRFIRVHVWAVRRGVRPAVFRAFLKYWLWVDEEVGRRVLGAQRFNQLDSKANELATKMFLEAFKQLQDQKP